MTLNAKAHRDILPLFLISLIMAVSCKSDPETESPVFDMFLNTILFESVPFISVDSLWALNDKDYFLLDAREKEEFLVSHIPGAKHIGYDEFTQDALPDADKNQTIILYCSVGYRSEKIGEKLQEAGYTDVRNLFGGIFEWVNRGGELVNESGKTNLIHPYSKIWGVWLSKGKKAYSLEEKSVYEDTN
jgi:rhodanese-related sulfurtransferase